MLERALMSLEDLPETADCLARAFHLDPLTTQLMPDAELRAKALPVIFRFCLRYTYEYGYSFLFRGKSGKIVGAIGIVDQDHHEMHADHDVAARMGASEIPKVTGEEINQRFDDFMNDVSKFRSECIARTARSHPFYYFSTCGVEPEAFGKSDLSTMLDEILRVIVKGNRTDLWGETWNAVALQIYTKRFPCRVIGETVVSQIPVTTFVCACP
jgi:hypothetical protein